MVAVVNWLLGLGESIVTCCSNPFKRSKDDDDDDVGSDIVDTLLWERELHDYSFGQFSFAMVQANREIEDEAQVESGPHGLFVGVYDGHGGTRASAFCCDNLFPHLIRIAQESGTISENILRSAISATEEGFMDVVHREHERNPNLTAVGSCCLAALLWRGTLYVGNLGDSRAVIGRITNSTNKVVAEPLTRDDNVNVEDVRQELLATYPNDQDIVRNVRGVWLVKGHIQLSKAIGDAYLKNPEYSRLPTNPRLHLSQAISGPVLSAEPSMVTRVLQSSDRFLICASDGLWDHISNQRAVQIVNKHPRQGIARRLLKAAIKVAARKSRVSYNKLKLARTPELRRVVHDDITVVVIFFNHEGGYDASVPGLSIKGYTYDHFPARFNLQGVV